MEKKEFYHHLKTAGLALFVPFVLLAGPVAGFILGGELEKAYGWPVAVPVCLGIFTIAGLFEAGRILIRLVRMTGVPRP